METIKPQGINYDLSRGHKAYDTKVKNIIGIFQKLTGLEEISKTELLEISKKGLLDVSKEAEDFIKIQDDLEEALSLNEFNNLLSKIEDDSSIVESNNISNIQLEYESGFYIPYNVRLDELSQRLENDALAFYELHTLSKNIDVNLEDLSNNTINEVIAKTIELIDKLNKLNTHNDKKKNRIVELAYQTIYSVILHEEIYSRRDVFNYLKQLNNSVNLESVGRLLSNDLNKLNTKLLSEKELEGLKKEGLGYDFLDDDIIKEVAIKTIGKINPEYIEQGRREIRDIISKSTSYRVEEEKLNKDLEEHKNSLKQLKRRKNIIITKMMSLVSISAAYSAGKNLSEKRPEYRTITRTINAKTGRIVGEVEEIFDEKETTYVATLLEKSPWKVNPNGGYISNVVAYEYVNSEDRESVIKDSLEMNENVVKKYQYIESKETLDYSDSMTETTLLITETYQDKSVSRPNEKYVLSYTGTAIVVSLIFDIAVLLVPSLGFEVAKKRLNGMINSIKESEKSEKEIVERLEEIKQYEAKYKAEYEESLKKYGSLAKEFIFEPINESRPDDSRNPFKNSLQFIESNQNGSLDSLKNTMQLNKSNSDKIHAILRLKK